MRYSAIVSLLLITSCAGPGEPPDWGDRAWTAAKEGLPGFVKSLTENPTPATAIIEGSNYLKAILLAAAGAAATAGATAGTVAVRRKRARARSAPPTR